MMKRQDSFPIGSAVTLTSGGLPMTVTGHNLDGFVHVRWFEQGGIARRYLLFRPHTYNCRRVYMRHYSDPLTAARELVGKLSSTNYW